MPSKHFHILIDKCKEIHDRKSHDYAQDSDPFSNFKYANYVAKPFPNEYKSYAVLIGIKLARLAELLSSGKSVKNESLEDSFIDAVNYVGLMGAKYLAKKELFDTLEKARANIGNKRGDFFTTLGGVPYHYGSSTKKGWLGLKRKQTIQVINKNNAKTSHQKRSKIRSRTVQTRNTRVQGRSLSKSREESRKKS